LISLKPGSGSRAGARLGDRVADLRVATFLMLAMRKPTSPAELVDLDAAWA
jgi:hypothetical protein